MFMIVKTVILVWMDSLQLYIALNNHRKCVQSCTVFSVKCSMYTVSASLYVCLVGCQGVFVSLSLCVSCRLSGCVC